MVESVMDSKVDFPVRSTVTTGEENIVLSISDFDLIQSLSAAYAK